MKLIESIASCNGESRKRIVEIINDDVKTIIAEIVKSHGDVSKVDANLINELIEMDIFQYREGHIKPNTAIFFEEDIERLYDPVFSIGADLADIVSFHSKDLENSSPNIKNFIGSIIGMGQGLHNVLKTKGLASKWQIRTGKYGGTKIDFNQECESFVKFGDDLQIKRIHQGKSFIGVVIGSGTDNYISYIHNLSQTNPNKNSHDFCNILSSYLTDKFPLLIVGEIYDDLLKEIAKISKIEIDDKSSVITVEDSKKYQPIIDKITQASTSYILDNINTIKELLSSTIVGKQGVPIENMMMNLWRFLRKAAAQKLYENGFLTDKVPMDGSITVFYENSIGYF